MVNHITQYEPAIFLGLVDDWQALSSWDISTETGVDNLSSAFQDELL